MFRSCFRDEKSPYICAARDRQTMRQTLEKPVTTVRGAVATAIRDEVAIERALQIRARALSPEGEEGETALATTMRTPGEDRALAAGFLYAEGIVRGRGDLVSLSQRDDDTIVVELSADAAAAAAATMQDRRFVVTGACGVCGRADLEALATTRIAPPFDRPRVAAAIVHELPAALRRAQAAFARTGGLHAAGLFALDGTLRAAHEDVGRHNAVDKLVGTLLLDDLLPARDCVLMVSGRASYELVQKAAAAGIPILAAVGAPSSLAVEQAEAAGMTLLGFVRDGGFNIYMGGARLEV
jgi:FdhD protein